MMFDGVRPSQYNEVKIFIDSIGPDIIISDKDIPNLEIFNFNSQIPVKIDNIFIHNDKTINDERCIYDPNYKNIMLTNSFSKDIKADLVCLLGQDYYGLPIRENTWFGKNNGISCVTCGGQPTPHLWWVLLLFEKNTNILKWGFHSFAWSFAGNENKCCLEKVNNKNTIFD